MTASKRPRVLDVTLRDGGFRNGFDFGEKVSALVVAGLDRVGVDYIEFSLRLPEPKGLNVNGENGFLKKIRAVAPKAKLAVMCVPGLTTIEDVREIKECGIDLIRVVFGYEEETSPGLLLVKEAKKLEMEAAVNISYTLRWEQSAIEKLSIDAAAAGADMLYIADSCGSMTPPEVKDRIALVKKAGLSHIGFHGHDNIGMALLNSIAAMEAGADFIDASLRGMGNSSGNLKTEIFLVYLNKMWGTHYDIVELLKLTHEFEEHVPQAKPVHTSQQIMLGCFDLHEKPEYLSAIERMTEDKKISWFDAVVASIKVKTVSTVRE